ncbi:uncharacterized protein BDZ99DRAFT_569869 [Mytilinidion resinicola]|uniref:Non-classical export protein 1 n=1 Tax=Mytilinidion resinicola TaxID=574789 RepID=A0A6A6YTM9_9PEZI|nr:uncharacterized protein BDZ99DRAFT_569869 [Mytilinidion resinicola]KAF2811928.1 hypothetical protein BDZ99DRAFT_569869 [Mytilinidion resinicola]
MSYAYIISKRLDPVFALAIGAGAAAARISREEKEKGRNAAQTVDVLRRRVGLAWEKIGAKWEGKA